MNGARHPGTSGDRVSDPRSSGPIGVFDSGVGGLSVWREIVRAAPREHTLYVADQAHVPYGPRSLSEIRGFAASITNFLLSQGAKVIVVACNTASAAALYALRDAYPAVPFVGMEPAVKPAAEHTAVGSIGVLATPTTFQGTLFRKLVDRFGARVSIYTQTCPGLVEAIERGDLSSERTRDLVAGCLGPLTARGIDQLVLGCTHYPFVRPTIEAILGAEIQVVDPAPSVARQVQRILVDRGLTNPSPTEGHHVIYTSGAVEPMIMAATSLVGYTASVRPVCWAGTTLHTVSESSA